MLLTRPIVSPKQKGLGRAGWRQKIVGKEQQGDQAWRKLISLVSVRLGAIGTPPPPFKRGRRADRVAQGFPLFLLSLPFSA